MRHATATATKVTNEKFTRQEKRAPIKRTDNVVGLFSNLMPGLCERDTCASLIVSASRLELVRFEASLAALEIGLLVSDEALTEIAKTSVDAKYGARPLQKTIELHIEFPLSQAVLQGRFVAGDMIIVIWENGAIRFMK